MTRQELEQVHSLDKEIRMWERELEKRRNMSLVASPLPQVGSSSGISDKVADRGNANVDLERKIEDAKAELTRIRDEAIPFILSIPDSQTRMIVYYRCIDGMSWKRISSEIGGGNSEDGVRMAYTRFFDERSGKRNA